MTITEFKDYSQAIAPIFTALFAAVTATVAVLGYRLADRRWGHDITEHSRKEKLKRYQAIQTIISDTPENTLRIGRLLAKRISSPKDLPALVELYEVFLDRNGFAPATINALSAAVTKAALDFFQHLEREKINDTQ